MLVHKMHIKMYNHIQFPNLPKFTYTFTHDLSANLPKFVYRKIPHLCPTIIRMCFHALDGALVSFVFPSMQVHHGKRAAIRTKPIFVYRLPVRVSETASIFRYRKRVLAEPAEDVEVRWSQKRSQRRRSNRRVGRS